MQQTNKTHGNNKKHGSRLERRSRGVTFSLQGARAGVLLVAPTEEHLKYVIQMHFPREASTNNTAEYEGLLAGLMIAADLRIKKLIVRGDSQPVVKQVNKDYQSPLMKAYVDEVRKLEERFNG